MKGYLKPIFIILLCVLMIATLALLSCNKIDNCDEKLEPKEYIQPTQKAHTSWEQEQLDKYYDLAIQQFPWFAEIPKNMLLEKISVNEGNPTEDFFITFVFTFGGKPT